MKKFLFFSLLSLANLVVLADIQFLQNGKTEYVIVSPDKPNEHETNAIADMRDILKESSGADFRIIKPAEAGKYTKRIFIGESASARKLTPDRKKASNEERIYFNKGNDIFIYGGGYCGTTLAIYQFLMDKIGFRSLHFWGEAVIPKHKTLTFKSLSYAKEPAYIYRELLEYSWKLSGCPTRYKAFRRMMMHGPGFYSVRTITGCHSFSSFIPSGKIYPGDSQPYAPFKGKAYFKTNPEYFSMDVSGKRTDKQHLCFSNPGLRKTFTENVEIYLKSRKMENTDVMIDFGQSDRGGKFCYCPQCLEFEKKYECGGGAFYNYLIEEASPYFAKKYPKMKIRVLSYGGRDGTNYPPPEHLLPNGKLPKNIVPFLCALGQDYSKPCTHPVNHEDYQSLLRWSKISQNAFVYYYFTTFARPLVSVHMFGNVLRSAQDYVECAKRNIRYAYNDFAVEFFALNAGFYGLQYYLMARLTNDPSIPFDTLIKEYTDSIYGKAAASMRAYFYELEKLGAADDGKLIWNPDPRFAEYLTPANLVRWQKNYDAMEKMVANQPNALNHLRCSRINLDLMTLLLWNEIRISGVKHSMNAETIYKRAVAAINLAHSKYFHELPKNDPNYTANKGYTKAIKERINATAKFFYQIAKGAKPLPPEFKNIPENNIRQVVPIANKDIISFEAEGAFGVTLPGLVPASKVVHYTFADPENKLPRIQKQIKAEPGKPYKMHFLGRTALSRAAWVIVPPHKYRTQQYVGGMNGHAVAHIGHYFDKKAPNQQWDIYVSNRFDNKQQVYTDRIVLIKVTDPSKKPLLAPDIPLKSNITANLTEVSDDDSVDWKKIPSIGNWANNLLGNADGRNIEMKAAYSKKNLYLQFTERQYKQGAKGSFWDDCVDIFCYGKTVYPMIQIGINAEGKTEANRYRLQTSMGDDGDQIIREPEKVPGKFTSTLKDGVWTWQAVIPLKTLPQDANGVLNINFFRSYGDGRPALAWSPVYAVNFRSNPGLFGRFFTHTTIFEGTQISAPNRTKDGIAYCDGNQGWVLHVNLPAGMDKNAKYILGAELRCDAEIPQEKFTSRFGLYDAATRKILVYRTLDVKSIKGGKFIPFQCATAVKLPQKGIIYLGGFVPSKKYKGNVYVHRFTLTKVD